MHQTLRNLLSVVCFFSVPIVANATWSHSVERDALTDALSTFAVKKAQSSTTNRYKGTELIIRCTRTRTTGQIPTLELYLSSPNHIRASTTTTQVRFDDGDIQRFFATPSTDHKALFFDRAEDILGFMSKANGRMRVQFTPYGESPVTLEYRLAPFGKALDRIEKTCPIRSLLQE